MGKFKSINYSRVVCEGCGSETSIEPGIIFNDLNCTCNSEESKACKEIKVFIDGDSVVELLGIFNNGDVEVKHTDGTLSYRVPKDTFENNFNEVTEDEDTTDNTPLDSTSEESDPSNTEVTLSLDALVGKTAEEIKDEFNMDELRVLAKASKIRGASQMNEDKLVEKLLQKV